jgi:hypothetical protein
VLQSWPVAAWSRRASAGVERLRLLGLRPFRDGNTEVLFPVALVLERRA